MDALKAKAPPGEPGGANIETSLAAMEIDEPKHKAGSDLFQARRYKPVHIGELIADFLANILAERRAP